MGIREWLIGPAETEEQGSVLTLDNIGDHYQVVDRVYNDMYGEAVIVTDKGAKLAERPVLQKELGSAGARWRRLLGAEEYNVALAGHEGIKKFDEMRRQDAAVRASLRLAKTPVLTARWSVEPAKRGDEEAEAQAEFIEYALFDAMTIDWDQILMEALLMLDFGYYMFEKVFTVKTWEGKQRVCWQKWAPRHPIDVTPNGWVYDNHGGPDGVWMTNFDGDGETFLPIEKLVVFTYDREANNMGAFHSFEVPISIGTTRTGSTRSMRSRRKGMVLEFRSSSSHQGSHLRIRTLLTSWAEIYVPMSRHMLFFLLIGSLSSPRSKVSQQIRWSPLDIMTVRFTRTHSDSSSTQERQRRRSRRSICS